LILQVSQGDQETADVIMDINERVNGDAMTAEQQALLTEQEVATEGIEDRQHAEQREMNRGLDAEMATEEMAVENAIQEEKRLVWRLFCTFTQG